jgi:hypothetical protein
VKPKRTGDDWGIFDGTVGWQDGSDHYDIGDDGVVLVKVTLFHGYNAEQAGEELPDDGRAHGAQILCRIANPANRIPPDGTQVHVSVPRGRLQIPGGGVIMLEVGAAADHQFSAEKTKLNFPGQHLVIKALSLTLTDEADRYFYVGPKGVKVGDADGSGAQLLNGKWMFYACVDGEAVAVLELSENKIMATCKSAGGAQAAGFKFNAGKCTVLCDDYANTAGSGVLGGTASPVSGIQYGPGMGVPSTSWKVAG